MKESKLEIKQRRQRARYRKRLGRYDYSGSGRPCQVNTTKKYRWWAARRLYRAKRPGHYKKQKSGWLARTLSKT